MNQICKEIFDSLELAIVTGDIDSAVDSIRELDEIDLGDDDCLDCKLFFEIVRLLDISSRQGDVAWHLFVWIVSKIGAMSKAQFQALREYVASTYKFFENDLLISEASEWIGWLRDAQSLEIVSAWLDSWQVLSDSGRRGVRASIGEFLDGNELSKAQRDLGEKLKEKCENLMRADRLKKLSLH